MKKPDLADSVSEILDSIAEEVERQMGELRFDGSDQHIVAALLLATIGEHCTGMRESIRKKRASTAWATGRSALEAFVDLVCLREDAGHVDCMVLAEFSEEKRLWKNVKGADKTHKYLGGLSEQNPEERLSNIEEEIKRLSEAGAQSLSIRGKFQKAGDVESYEGPYNIYCREVHNNLSTLKKRHLEWDSDGRPLIYPSKEIDRPELMMIGDTTARLLPSACQVVWEITTGEQREMPEIDRLIAELSALWKEEGDEAGEASDAD